MVNLTIPRSFDELTYKQLLFVSDLYLQGLTKSAFLVKAFACLSGLKILSGKDGSKDDPVYYFRIRKGKPFPMKMSEIMDFSRECAFLLYTRANFRPLPSIAGRKARDRMMYDACFSEFVAGMVYYNQIKDINSDVLLLHKLCAIMYPDGEWDPDNIRYESFERMPLTVCYTVFLWFGMILNRIAAECPNLFRESDENNEPVSLRENIHAMYNIVTDHDITKEKEIGSMDMFRVLYDMDERALQIRETNEQLKK